MISDDLSLESSNLKQDLRMILRLKLFDFKAFPIRKL